MSIEKLSLRAKEVLLNIPAGKRVNVGSVVDAISNVQGLGYALLKTFPKIALNKETLVDINHLIKEAFYQSIKLESSYVGTEHLLLALLSLTQSTDFTKVHAELIKMNAFPNAAKTIEKGRRTPLLEAFGENLNNRLFKDFERPLLPRSEYKTLLSVLLQKNNANALIVGDSGVGKSSIIEVLARNINTLDIPPLLAGYQIIEFDLVSFMTSILNKGGSDLGLASLTDELKSLGRVLVSIKNFQNIFIATNVGFAVPLFYSMFKSAMESAEIRLIATVDRALYDKISVDNDHVFDTFSVIEVDEPTEKEIVKLLEYNAVYLGKFHNVEIPSVVIDYVYKRAKEDLKDIKFPQKGLDLLDQACARLIMKKSKLPERYKNMVDKTYLLARKLDKNIEQGDYSAALQSRDQIKKNEASLLKVEENLISTPKLVLTTKEVDEALEDLGLTKKELTGEADLLYLTSVFSKIRRSIIGQDEAVDIVVKSLIRSRLGLRSKKRPLGNFLFLGPTGVGKTELAKVLAEVVFPPKEKANASAPSSGLIRLDMSDFAEKHNVARLVGAPPGYIGYGEGGELTQKIEQRPDSVVLFDEIEKAHPDVLNVLLQIMEEGELTDAKGNVFDFSKAVIILTSNLGTELIQNGAMGLDEKKLDASQMEERLKINLKRLMKAELLNRFDEVIVFKQLNSDSQLAILNLLINEVIKTLKMQKVTLTVNLAVKKLLLAKGYSDEYGARSLRRTLEKELLDKVAEILLQHAERPLRLIAKSTADALTIEKS